jgi:hypothetical protein
MPKVKFDKDEWYPYYFRTDSPPPIGREVDLTEEELAFFEMAVDDFRKAQDMIRNRIEELDVVQLGKQLGLISGDPKLEVLDVLYLDEAQAQ